MLSPRLKSLLLPLSLVLLTASPGTQAQNTKTTTEEVLTNESVITMTQAGLSAAIIISKIRSSKTNFNTSTDNLIRLKRERVADDVINAMVEASSSESARVSRTGAGDISKTNPNDPLSPHEAGIYLLQDSDGQKRMLQLEPSVYTQSKSGGMWKSAMTYGIAKVKSKAVLANQNARLQIDKPRPAFYFYFEVKGSGLSGSGNAYSASTSPNEFVLVKMEEKKNSRELVVGQFNMFGAESGTLDKYARPFDYEKLAPGVFKVTPRVDLTDGEYGFFYGGSSPMATYGYFGAGGGPKVFDFGIKLPR